MQISRHHVGPRMTQMVIHGDTIYLCGQDRGRNRGGRRPDSGDPRQDRHSASRGRQLEVEAAPGPDLAR